MNNLVPKEWWARLRDIELKNKTLAKISTVMIIGLNVNLINVQYSNLGHDFCVEQQVRSKEGKTFQKL